MHIRHYHPPRHPVSLVIYLVALIFTAIVLGSLAAHYSARESAPAPQDVSPTLSESAPARIHPVS